MNNSIGDKHDRLYVLHLDIVELIIVTVPYHIRVDLGTHQTLITQKLHIRLTPKLQNQLLSTIILETHSCKPMVTRLGNVPHTLL